MDEDMTMETASEGVIDQIVEESRDDEEEAGRDDAEAIISRIIGALDERIAPITERLSAIERAQRDTFANVVQSAAIVSNGASEVDATPQPTVGDYDLSI